MTGEEEQKILDLLERELDFARGVDLTVMGKMQLSIAISLRRIANLLQFGKPK